MAPWSDDLVTGNKKIDNDHRVIVTFMDVLCEDVEKGNISERFPQAIDFLMEYYTQHFESEEVMMHTYGYPDWGTHRASHLSFFDRLVYWSAHFKKEGVTAKNVSGMVDELRDYMKNHVMDQDRAFANFVRTASEVPT